MMYYVVGFVVLAIFFVWWGVRGSFTLADRVDRSKIRVQILEERVANLKHWLETVRAAGNPNKTEAGYLRDLRKAEKKLTKARNKLEKDLARLNEK